MANIQGQQQLINHHWGKNIMTKSEESVKPQVWEGRRAKKEDLDSVRARFQHLGAK